MSNFTEPLNNFVKDGEQYVNAQMDSLKLHSIKGLSMGLSTVASLLLIFILGSVLLLALSFALVMWLGQLLGSYVLSAFIVAGVLFIALVTCLLLRERLFKNTFVGPLRDALAPSVPLKEDTLEAIDAALVVNQVQVDAAEEQLAGGVEQIREFYTPRNIINHSLQQLGNQTARSGFSVGRMAVGMLRRFIQKH